MMFLGLPAVPLRRVTRRWLADMPRCGDGACVNTRFRFTRTRHDRAATAPDRREGFDEMEGEGREIVREGMIANTSEREMDWMGFLSPILKWKHVVYLKHSESVLTAMWERPLST